MMFLLYDPSVTGHGYLLLGIAAQRDRLSRGVGYGVYSL